MFFVGVQLDITKPPTPKANNQKASPLQPSRIQSHSPAANAHQSVPTQQPSTPLSPAASCEVQSAQASQAGQARNADTTHQVSPIQRAADAGVSHQHPAQVESLPQEQYPAPMSTSEVAKQAQTGSEEHYPAQVASSQAVEQAVDLQAVAEQAADLQEGHRQLLSIQSAPAGSPLAAAAARAALLPDGHHDLHAQTHAARRRALLADVPECGEVSASILASLALSCQGATQSVVD